eukprot:SM000190S04845  [mRNA]  locus=s190:56232:57421:+ [translate_table: standard]
MPAFMPWISSVQVQPDQPELSRWTLEYAAFGQPLRFSWLARNLQVPPPPPPPLLPLLAPAPLTAVQRSDSRFLVLLLLGGARIGFCRQPIHHQKIHWRSVDGLPNRGAVRFYPRGPLACEVEQRLQLTISYEVPDFLAPLASSLRPLVESIIQKDMERFATYARVQSHEAASPR